MHSTTKGTRTRSALLALKFWLLISLLQFRCSHNAEDVIVAPVNKFIAPQYGLAEINLSTDTIHFSLDDSTFRSINSYNLFTKDGEEFIAFFDERSLSVNVYHFQTRKKLQRISLKKLLEGHKLVKTTAYMLSPDSIFVNNNKTFYFLNGSGEIKTKIDFLQDPPLCWATFENDAPPVVKDGRLYASVRAFMNDESLKALKKWKVLYEFDLKTGKANLFYRLPEFLRENLYGTRFLDHSYCYNDHGRFVFSFPADSAIYETNLNDYHIAYSGKSRFQKAMIPSMTQKEVDEGRKQFKLRDSYSSIYFDPVKKRYLRVAQSAISEQDRVAKKENEKRIIVFDENFRRIGESPVDNSISLRTLFITKDGSIYARVLSKDEHALHFVRFSYSDKNIEPSQIVKHENDQNK